MLRSIVSCGIAVALGFGSGCAGNRAALRSENSRLRMEVTELKADRRRDRRKIRDLKRRLSLAEQDRSRDLPVEVVGPAARTRPEPAPVAPAEPAPEVAYADDDVEILYVGEAARDDAVRPSLELYQERDRAPYRVATGAPPVRARTGDRLPITRGKVPPLPRESKSSPRELYRQYYDALRAGDHAAAIEGFRAFVADFAGSPYADNAQYWLAEAYYDQREYARALAEFRRVWKLFPKGNKVSDAMLKAAYCHEHLGDVAKARAELAKVIKRFPKSNAAAIAADRLVKLQADE